MLKLRQLARGSLGVGSQDMPGPVSTRPMRGGRDQQNGRALWSPAGWLASIGQQRLQLWIDRQGMGC